MKLFVLVLALATLGTTVLGKTDYCDPSLCENEEKKGPHIACDGLKTLSDDCGSDAEEIPITKAQQAMIVDLHNQLRSRVASGKQSYSSSAFYPSAARMATMRWDSELAAIAAANVRRCQNEHDDCRNTPKYTSAGQNIANTASQGSKDSNDKLIRDFINDWFSEYAVANPKQVAKYPAKYKGADIGHFTQIVADRATAVGCAMVRYKDGGWTNHNFVCNYAITNIVNQPIYVAGKACSKCTTGCNPKYPGLCNPEEKIVPK